MSTKFGHLLIQRTKMSSSKKESRHPIFWGLMMALLIHRRRWMLT